MKIRGNTVGTPTPRTDWNQTDPTKADYLKGKEELDAFIQGAHTAAGNAQTAANNAQAAATNAQNTANSKALKKERTATLSSSGWSNLQQTVNVDGVTADNTVIVVAAPDSYMPCLENSIRCVAQAAGSLTFQCATAPTVNVTFNILILE